jgi:chemotaxis family two-component system response regulator Rcp1
MTQRNTAEPPTERPAPSPRPDPRARPGPFCVLLVEDNHGDVRLVREALADHGTRVELSVAHDGRAALDRLRGPARRPDLILLDLNLPGMDGVSLLGRIKSDPKLRRIPVVVLTSSDSAAEVERVYDLHANCYLVKRPTLSEFERHIRHTIDFWTDAVRLPQA